MSASPSRLRAAMAALVLLLAACGSPVPTASMTAPTPGQSGVPTTMTVASPAPAATMRAEVAAYLKQYCASIEAWDTALDHAIDWSSAARLDRSAATTMDPEVADAIAVMRAENAAIATFPPVVPISRALERAADRLERVIGLLAPVMAGPGVASTELDAELPGVFADMAAAAEFHRVAEGSYGRLDCPPDPRERLADPTGIVSVAMPDGWRQFGPSADERESELEGIGDAASAARLRAQGDQGGTVLFDAADVGHSRVGAVSRLVLLPDETDLLGAMETIEAELASAASSFDGVVRYVDRPAGDGARLVARPKGPDDPDLLIVDVVRVNEGLVVILSLVAVAEAPTYWLAIERIVGSMRVDAPAGADGGA